MLTGLMNVKFFHCWQFCRVLVASSIKLGYHAESLGGSVTL